MCASRLASFQHRLRLRDVSMIVAHFYSPKGGQEPPRPWLSSGGSFRGPAAHKGQHHTSKHTRLTQTYAVRKNARRYAGRCSGTGETEHGTRNTRCSELVACTRLKLLRVSSISRHESVRISQVAAFTDSAPTCQLDPTAAWT